MLRRPSPTRRLPAVLKALKNAKLRPVIRLEVGGDVIIEGVPIDEPVFDPANDKSAAIGNVIEGAFGHD